MCQTLVALFWRLYARRAVSQQGDRAVRSGPNVDEKGTLARIQRDHLPHVVTSSPAAQISRLNARPATACAWWTVSQSIVANPASNEELHLGRCEAGRPRLHRRRRCWRPTRCPRTSGPRTRGPPHRRHARPRQPAVLLCPAQSCVPDSASANQLDRKLLSTMSATTNGMAPEDEPHAVPYMQQVLTSPGCTAKYQH